MSNCGVFLGSAIAAYGFGEGHPFGLDRHDAFVKRFKEKQLQLKTQLYEPQGCSDQAIARFHSTNYIQKVKKLSQTGFGVLDQGDTPAFKGAYETSATVAGTVLHAYNLIQQEKINKAFIPIAGLHHARRKTAAGFCIFNDIGILIEHVRITYNVKKIAYVDIDAHHGDGVFYEYEDDPNLFIVDIHQDGKTLYPGTGHADETGKGLAQGTKLNFPLPPFASDGDFDQVWPKAVEFLDRAKPELIILQSGADSISGDPITSMRFSAQSFYKAAVSCAVLAEQHCRGHLIALGGGGYNRENLAEGWSQIVSGMLTTS